MKPLAPVVLLSLLAAACGTPATVATTTPAPVPTPVTTPAPVTSSRAAGEPTTVPAVTLAEAPRDWQLLDEATDHVPGIGANRAMRELLAGQSPKQTVLVAIIDNGIDTTHADLRANLWVNPKEIGGNHQDDDHNGYVDDVHGWNFIGGANGQDVHFDTFEVTREYARCHGLPGASGAPRLTDATYCAKIDTAYEKQRNMIQSSLQNYREAETALKTITPLLQQAAGTDSLTIARVRAISPSTPQISQAREIYLELASQGATLSMIEEGVTSFQGQLDKGLNPSFDPRTIVGDNYADPTQHYYGNSDVMGQDAMHGTHVAGIIGAVRGNGIGVDGIAPAVKLMMIRTVPDGDERDKDVANAIRYATDNGAKIISMSFGKGYSPYKQAVDDAVKYADAHGVLMIHAAGNDGANLDSAKNFPTPNYLGGGHPVNWIEVGASSWKGGDSLAANFSNYSHTLVDVFAPGVDILSTTPGSQYQRLSGTSMAAPVVSGLAALIMDYYPNLTAADIRQVIVGSVSRYDQTVARPGDDASQVSFSALSKSGGIVNAYKALQMAAQLSASKPQP
jgi:subtilisin family serine protease